MDVNVAANGREALAETPHTVVGAQTPSRDALRSMLRGIKKKCPNCGKGALYSRFLKVNCHCTLCGEELFHERSDDAAPYLTIAIVGHIIVAGVWALEDAYQPALWLQFALWLPVTALMSLLLLPRVKGALVGLQWALRMHGFGGGEVAIAAPENKASLS
jgi:uncharacterized protein (DUF983 family)